MNWLCTLLLVLSTTLLPAAESAVVVGGGVGGLTAAVYLARAGLKPLVYEGALPGGLITQSHAVQNWPGEIEISGHELATKLRAQAVSNGVRFSQQPITAIDFTQKPFKLTAQDGTSLSAQTIILAMGTTPNFLNIPGEKTYWGRGVTNCAVCDGALYKNQIVGVVGGGDAAVLEALYLSNIAKEVHVFVRKSAFKGTEKQRLETLLKKPNVKVQFDTTVTEVKGNGNEVTGVVLKNKKSREFALSGLFLAIGSTPNTKWLKNIALDGKGYIVLKHDQETSVPGVYAVGDVVDPVYKQAVTASGEGAKAALQAEKQLAGTATAQVVEISTQEQFREELASTDGPVCVDFYASWCPPCKLIAPLVETTSSRLVGKVKFLKVNVDNVPDLAAVYRIRSMPTVLLFDATGNILDRKTGSQDIMQFLNVLNVDS